MPRSATITRRRALLRRARQVIQRRFRDPELNLAAVAEAVGTSTRQLQRVFREEAGEDFRTYLLGIRMHEARRLLVEREVPPTRFRRASVTGVPQFVGTFERPG